MNNTTTSRFDVYDVTLFELHHGDWGLYINLTSLFAILIVISTTILRFPFRCFLNGATTETLVIQWIKRSEVQGLAASIVTALGFCLSYENEGFAVRKNEPIDSRSIKNLASTICYIVGTVAYLACYLIYHRSARKINKEAVEGYILPVTIARVNFILDVVVVVTTSVVIYCFVKAVEDPKHFVIWYTFGTGVMFGSLAVSLFSWVLKARAYKILSVRSRVKRPQFADEYNSKAKLVRKYALVLFLLLTTNGLLSFAVSYRFLSFVVYETSQVVFCVPCILQVLLIGVTLESKELSSDRIRQLKAEG